MTTAPQPQQVRPFCYLSIIHHLFFSLPQLSLMSPPADDRAPAFPENKDDPPARAPSNETRIAVTLTVLSRQQSPSLA